tara:strand:+ start:2181 stop:2531 length:351 start_codon:yes stop_codon:yes gene_type:complete
MAGFGLPNFGQLGEAFKKAKEIQQNAQKLQEELDEMKLEGKSSDDKVSIWLSGNQSPLKITIDESLIQEGHEKIELSILEALKDAHEISTSTMKSRMEELTGGLKLNLPGFQEDED